MISFFNKNNELLYDIPSDQIQTYRKRQPSEKGYIFLLKSRIGDQNCRLLLKEAYKVSVVYDMINESYVLSLLEFGNAVQEPYGVCYGLKIFYEEEGEQS